MKSIGQRKAQAWRNRRGTAFLLALFVMAVATALVVSIVDAQTLQYAALRNSLDYDRARYLAESGMQHALSFLEQDITWRGALNDVEFPAGSGHTYTVTVADGPNGTVTLTAVGSAGTFARRLQVTLKMGG